MKRKATSKRLRFEVFERDGFVCQYCGASPPDVVLEVDHVSPVSVGGETEPDNLVTSCFACNRGKANRVLGQHVTTRPDHDLAYLKTQQEIGELLRFKDSLRAREAAKHEVAEALSLLWNCGVAYPLHEVMRFLDQEIRPEFIESALLSVSNKVSGGYLPMNCYRVYSYLRATVRNVVAEAAE